MPVVENSQKKGTAPTNLELLEDLLTQNDETHESGEEESDEDFAKADTRKAQDAKPKQEEKKSKTKEDQGKEYFQSKYDKASALLKKLGIEDIDNANLTDLQRDAEIGKLLKENPQELLKALNIEIPKQESQEKKVALVKPVKPVKPANYNRQEALLDDTSPSYHYEQALSEYHEKLADYNETFINQVEGERIAKQREMEMTESQKQARLKVITELVTDEGFSKAEAEDFLETVNGLKDRKDWVKVYKLLKGNTETKETKKAKPSTVVPAIVESSDDDSDSEELDFMDMQTAFASKNTIRRK